MFHDEFFVLTFRTRTAAAPCILFIQPKYFEKAEEFGGRFSSFFLDLSLPL